MLNAVGSAGGGRERLTRVPGRRRLMCGLGSRVFFSSRTRRRRGLHRGILQSLAAVRGRRPGRPSSARLEFGSLDYPWVIRN
jgi:hypothetical protein